MSKFHKLPVAAVRKGDHPAMIAAIERLEREDIDTRRPPHNAYQLKVLDRINFYPVKGTIFIDEETQAREARGLSSLVKLVRAIENGEEYLEVELED